MTLQMVAGVHHVTGTDGHGVTGGVPQGNAAAGVLLNSQTVVVHKAGLDLQEVFQIVGLELLGVGIDECEKFSRAVEEVLDREDIIATEYSLEVSSPGLERDLVKEEHFEAYVGERIKVKLIRAVDGQRDFNGILEDFDGHAITLRLEDGGAIVFDKKAVGSVNIHFEF